MSSYTFETVAEIVTVEDWVERTPYGELPTRSRKIERVVRWIGEGRLDGHLELRVDYWRNGIRLPGSSDGNPTRIAEALSRASA